MTPHCPGAMVVWAQQKWDDPHLHLMLYVTSEPLCSSQSGCKTELQLMKLKLDLCASISFWVSWPQQNCPIPFLRDILSSFKASTPAKNKLVNLVGACEYNLLWKAPLPYLGFSLTFCKKLGQPLVPKQLNALVSDVSKNRSGNLDCMFVTDNTIVFLFCCSYYMSYFCLRK